MTETAFYVGLTPGKRKIGTVVREGLTSQPKRLPPWLFYDDAGSRLFERITELPEYYLTRTERSILAKHAAEIVGITAQNESLRITELGAGSSEKTRILLEAAMKVNQKGFLLYEPVDLVASALVDAKMRIEREIHGVRVAPRLEDYTHGLLLDPANNGERRLVLYIGSSIGNFAAEEALQLLQGIRRGLKPGDALLLGTDLVKDEATLLVAYDDAAGVTAEFNLNLLMRLNRELRADFDLSKFTHRALWNAVESRIEMHLESRIQQQVRIRELDTEGDAFVVDFSEGESIHTENSYKFRPGEVENLLVRAEFEPVKRWTDEKGWFAVCLARAR
jgi:dimethylhistidine N-methyltransferase